MVNEGPSLLDFAGAHLELRLARDRGGDHPAPGVGRRGRPVKLVRRNPRGKEDHLAQLEPLQGVPGEDKMAIVNGIKVPP